MRVGKLALIPVLLFTACTDEPVAPDAGFIEAARGGIPGKPGGDDGDSFNYTITDLGTDLFLSDINDDGVLVGSTDGQAAVWQAIGAQPLLLGGPDGAGSWGTRINAAGTRVIGGHRNAAQNQAGDLWKLDGGTVTRVSLNPLTDDNEVNPSGINDNGQVVGQTSVSWGSWESHSPVLWDPDGSGGMVARDLGFLDGHPGAWAHGLNNAGHVVGRSGIGPGADGGRAVLWIVDGGNATIFDLIHLSPGPGPDDSGDNIAFEITEPDVSNGHHVQISGYTTIAGQVRPTVWTVTVDVQNKAVTVLDVQLEEGGTGPFAGNDINENGEVTLIWGAVWTLEGNSVESLPTLSDRCRSSAFRINNSGTVIGRSSVHVRGRCVRHTVLWTKK